MIDDLLPIMILGFDCIVAGHRGRLGFSLVYRSNALIPYKNWYQKAQFHYNDASVHIQLRTARIGKEQQLRNISMEMLYTTESKLGRKSKVSNSMSWRKNIIVCELMNKKCWYPIDSLIPLWLLCWDNKSSID